MPKFIKIIITFLKIINKHLNKNKKFQIKKKTNFFFYV